MPETHIIAELAWGHDGTRSQAIDIMRHAIKAGADSFSIHITDLPSYIVPHYGGGKGKVSEGREALDIYKYLEKINLDHGDWKEIKAEADRIGMQLCIMPNDMASFRFAEEWMNPDYYVLSPASFIEHDLMLQIAGTGRDTLFRTGGATLAEIENAVNIFRKAGSRIILLHGYQNYPTSIGDTNLALLKTLKDLFGTEVGLADHIDGGSPLARIIPLLSLCYGATYIEKHITLDRSKKSEDFESALDPDGFAEFVSFVRSAELTIGSPDFQPLTESALRYREITRKRVVALKDIESGAVLTRENTGLMRSDSGEPGELLDHLLGRKTKVRLAMFDGIMKENLE